jgi:hypothetical protein
MPVKKRSKLIAVPDHFDESIEEIAADINRVRASALGIAQMPDSAAASADETPVGLPGFAVPWLTFALLALLSASSSSKMVFRLLLLLRGPQAFKRLWLWAL